MFRYLRNVRHDNALIKLIYSQLENSNTNKKVLICGTRNRESSTETSLEVFACKLNSFFNLCLSLERCS